MSNLVNLTDFVRSNAPLCVITGAGCSTPSGIYDYRDQSGAWKRPEPVQLQDFLTKSAARRRYWARSMLGFPRFEQARPNPAHKSLVELEKLGVIQSVISQNVDDLHEIAGQSSLVKLHGSLSTATCVDCLRTEARTTIQQRLESLNARFLSFVENPADGGESVYTKPIDQSFTIPACLNCGGILKPDVVFFGGSIPTRIKKIAQQAVLDAQGLLLVGTTSQVFSCYRLVRDAHDAGIPIAAINKGKTRVDDLLSVQIGDSIESVLPRLVNLVAHSKQS